MHSSSLPAVIEQLGATPPPGQWTEFDRPRQIAFLTALAECGNVRAAAASCGVSYRTAYRARRREPAFRQAWTGALLAARPVSEDVLTTRAIDGVEEQVFYHGEVIATRRRYSDRLLLAHLGRLDKLCDDALANAIAEDFEDALERFAAGEELTPLPPENSVPEHRDKCDKSNSASAEAESEPHPAPAHRVTLRWCEHARELVTPTEWLLNAMTAARPDGARTPGQFAGYDPDAVEEEQMAAFEEGVERWWLVVPPSSYDNAPEWTFAEEDDLIGGQEPGSGRAD